MADPGGAAGAGRAAPPAILRLVAHDELAAGEIAAAFDVTRTAVSQHLTVLSGAWSRPSGGSATTPAPPTWADAGKDDHGYA